MEVNDRVTPDAPDPADPADEPQDDRWSRFRTAQQLHRVASELLRPIDLELTRRGWHVKNRADVLRLIWLLVTLDGDWRPLGHVYPGQHTGCDLATPAFCVHGEIESDGERWKLAGNAITVGEWTIETLGDVLGEVDTGPFPRWRREDLNGDGYHVIYRVSQPSLARRARERASRQGKRLAVWRYRLQPVSRER